MFLLHNMVHPHYPVLGVLDSRDELGQAAIFSEINMRLAELVRTRYKNVYLVDEDRIQSHCGKARATDPRMWFTARMPWGEEMLAGISREYMRYVAAANGLSRKCIVVDLDNTLWGGVVGEDGASGIQLGSEAPGNAYVALQNELEKLSRRGVLLAICSKNNLEDALPVLESHPEMVLRMSHFAAVRINWTAKPANIREIARELNIGLDSLVFLDDNPVERAAVRSELPEVLTPELPSDPAGYRRALLEIMGVFDTLTLTNEDRERNRLYAEQRLRQEARTQLEQSGSLEDYLTDLAITVDIEEANDVSLPRIAQLTSKTNQFNLTTRRYTVAEISHKQSLGARVLSARVRDRFGDNGLTAVAIVESDGTSVWSIDTLLLSCRVMGRGVETALLSFIVDMARRSGVRQLRGTYLPTAKNSVVRSVYADHGFTLIEETVDGHSSWRLDVVEQDIRVPAWMTLQEPMLTA
jgi:FkbH-like protein